MIVKKQSNSTQIMVVSKHLKHLRFCCLLLTDSVPPTAASHHLCIIVSSYPSFCPFPCIQALLYLMMPSFNILCRLIPSPLSSLLKSRLTLQTRISRDRKTPNGIQNIIERPSASHYAITVH